MMCGGMRMGETAGETNLLENLKMNQIVKTYDDHVKEEGMIHYAYASRQRQASG